MKPDESRDEVGEDEELLAERLVEFWETQDVGMMLRVLVNSCVYHFV